MTPLHIGSSPGVLRVLCLGAHSDDIEIGCAGTLLRWMDEYERVELTWAVLCGRGERGEEARRSAEALCAGAASCEIVLGELEDAYLPSDFRQTKAFVTSLRREPAPDVVLTHRLEDRHQDHRALAELTWQTWRDHLVLEYEIPKYEGDLGQPNMYVPIPEAMVRRKVAHLLEHFGSQRSKDWFTGDAFQGLMRIRGVECRAPSGHAEAFHVRKAVL